MSCADLTGARCGSRGHRQLHCDTSEWELPPRCTGPTLVPGPARRCRKRRCRPLKLLRGDDAPWVVLLLAVNGVVETRRPYGALGCRLSATKWRRRRTE
ncbi:hypothetical protein NDU88_002076 [Pleurodeles waltl]|uniref:Uncharacterized protein n=1 Tax=Pleurodeles waltl TaxID=8319 RepID=A0AAV7UC69_PLEWA|nr:hypothetical protein NDU88_002076 [Pleurodeles waltl]